ncbi:hypothetical protein IWQ60_006029 [Tieghemiomyces parasiticus]|uniref:Spindle pole body component n=1 Tax=Tieghemiomyces parasiticus TaxID=78921 RepID=A0A9W8A8U0_9FUNG|nr:hypothetical protein IWQ60_006029 [Tieghemiomyces parasiticus]
MALGGLPSDVFQLDSTQTRLLSRPGAGRLPQLGRRSLFSLLADFAELGTFMLKLRAVAATLHTSPSEWGQTGCAFGTALNNYLNLTQRCLFRLFAELRSVNRLTLLSLRYRVSQIHATLRFLARFCFSIDLEQTLTQLGNAQREIHLAYGFYLPRGSALVSYLYSTLLTRSAGDRNGQPDPVIPVLQLFLDRASQPLLKWLRNWLGYLSPRLEDITCDPYREFMFTGPSANKVSRTADLFLATRPRMIPILDGVLAHFHPVPAFLTQAQVWNMMDAGHALAWLRNHGGEKIPGWSKVQDGPNWMFGPVAPPPPVPQSAPYSALPDPVDPAPFHGLPPRRVTTFVTANDGPTLPLVISQRADLPLPILARRWIVAPLDRRADQIHRACLVDLCSRHGWLDHLQRLGATHFLQDSGLRLSLEQVLFEDLSQFMRERQIRLQRQGRADPAPRRQFVHAAAYLRHRLETVLLSASDSVGHGLHRPALATHLTLLTCRDHEEGYLNPLSPLNFQFVRVRYMAPPALGAVFSPAALDRAERTFLFVLQLRGVGHALAQITRRMFASPLFRKCRSSNDSLTDAARAYVAMATRLQWEMGHFVRALDRYLNAEVFGRTWQPFLAVCAHLTARLNHADSTSVTLLPSAADLRAYHESVWDTIRYRTLQRYSTPRVLRHTLQGILETILRFGHRFPADLRYWDDQRRGHLPIKAAAADPLAQTRDLLEEFRIELQAFCEQLAQAVYRRPEAEPVMSDSLRACLADRPDLLNPTARDSVDYHPFRDLLAHIDYAGFYGFN